MRVNDSELSDQMMKQRRLVNSMTFTAPSQFMRLNIVSEAIYHHHHHHHVLNYSTSSQSIYQHGQ